MVKPIGFSAFLKLLELSEARRRAELKKKLGGGKGFQYWRPLQLVAPKAILPSADIEALKTDIDNLCSGHQRKYNKNAFVAFCKWTSGKTLEPTMPLPPIDVPFGSSGLVVRLKPDVSFTLDGLSCSMNVWATTQPILSAQTLSVGLLFCASAYRAQGYRDHHHLILVTIKNRLFREEHISPNSLNLLKDKVNVFKRDWNDLNSPTPSSPERPPDRPSASK